MKKIIIDTDIGTDVDDALAIAYALRSDALDVRLITTVHEPADIRARIVKSLSQALGRNVRAVQGHDTPLDGKKYLISYIGNGYGTGDHSVDERNAEEAIKDACSENGKIDIVSIGPGTNIAYFLRKFPELKEKINRIYVMGGVKEREGRFVLDRRAHNTMMDVEAAEVIFNSGLPLTYVTSETGKKASLTHFDFERIRRKDLAGRMIAQNADDWLKISRYNVAYLYDPLCVAVCEDASIAKMRQYGNVSVVEDINIDFRKKLLGRLLR